MRKQILLIAVLFFALKLYSQHTYVFFGSYNNGKAAEGIYVYQLDTINGKLSKCCSVKNVLNPSYITLSPDGKYIYASSESKIPNGGSVSSFEFDAENKQLTFVNGQKSGGENPVYVSVHENGRWLVNGNYTGGSVSVYPIGENGTIKPAVQNFVYTDGSVDEARQKQSHIHSAIFSPRCDYVFLPDLGADKIRCYKFNKNKNLPLEEAKQPFTKSPLGSGPRHLTFHPNGKIAYCIEEMAGTVSVYKYKKGKLKGIQRIKTHPETQAEGFASSEVHISPDGRFAYASNRGRENNIAIFEIQRNGKLKLVGYQSTLGNHPRVFAIDEEGKFLIATNLKTGNVFVFRRNAQTGLLQHIGEELKIKNVSCVKIRKY